MEDQITIVEGGLPAPKVTGASGAACLQVRRDVRHTGPPNRETKKIKVVKKLGANRTGRGAAQRVECDRSPSKRHDAARRALGTRFAHNKEMLALVAPPAPAPTTFPGPERAPEVRSAPAAPRVDETNEQKKRNRWMLSLEGAVHAPTDLGVQASVEVPFRLRVFGGFGVMPVNWITGFIAGATRDERAKAVLQLPDYSGTIWRAGLGYRPFKRLGLYLDAGYAHVGIHGSFDVPENLLGEELGVGGGYTVDTSLDLWLLEAGYQWQIARRGVVALGVGVMSTVHASTTIGAVGGAPRTSEFVSGAERANDALESYGTIPFVTLRVGVDVL